MSRNLIALNLLLLALLAAAILKIRDNWRGYLGQEQTALNRVTAPLPPAALPPRIAPAPLTAAMYVEIASQFLLSRDRNPNIVVEVEAPKPAPPLPRFYGVMDFGEGPRVILADKPGGKQKSYLLGEKVGDFKLVAVSPREIVFEWEGKRMTASPMDLADKSAPAAAPQPQQAAASAAPAQSTTIVSSGPSRPGAELTSTRRACPPGDNNPAGAVVDGYRKVLADTPFGKSCWYEKTN